MLARQDHGAIESAEAENRRWAALERSARLLAKSTLVPKPFQGKPEDIMAVGLSYQSLGVDLNLLTLTQAWVSDGKVNLMAQVQIAIAAGHGIDVWFAPGDSDEKHATVSIRKPGSSRVDKFTYTIEDAERAGLLDEWWEMWVDGSGGSKGHKLRHVIKPGVPDPDWKTKPKAQRKRKDPWHLYPAQMLMARAVTKGLKIAAPHVLLGLGGTPTLAGPTPPPGVDPETGERLEVPEYEDPEDDTIDAELVDESGAESDEGGGRAAEGDDSRADSGTPTPAPSGIDEWDRDEIAHMAGRLDDQHRAIATAARKEAGLPPFTQIATREHAEQAKAILTTIGNQQAQTYAERCKEVDDLLRAVGIKTDEARHALIREATGGDTESSRALTDAQVQAVREACERLAAADTEPEEATA